MSLGDLTNAETKTLQEKFKQKEAGEYLHCVIRLRSGYGTNSWVCNINSFDTSPAFVEGEKGVEDI